jgi:hypothetical protein
MKPLSYKKNGYEYSFTPLPNMTQADIEKCVPELKVESKIQPVKQSKKGK